MRIPPRLSTLLCNSLYFIPLFVFGILSGAIADWVDRRALLRGIELSFAANMTLFAVLVALGFAQLWLVMVFTLLSGALRALHQPVRVSYAYDLVGGRQVVAGLGLLNLGSRSGQLIGTLLAGSVMHRFGVPAAFVVLAAGHAMAFVCFARLRSVGIAAVEQRTPIKQNLREYFAELRGNGILLMLVAVTASVEVFGFSFATALPELAITRLNLGAEGLGMMHAARARRDRRRARSGVHGGYEALRRGLSGNDIRIRHKLVVPCGGQSVGAYIDGCRRGFRFGRRF